MDIWSSHKPASDSSACRPDDDRAAKLMHDIKNNLTVPLVLTGYLASKGDSELQREKASSVTHALQTGRSMIQAFMQVSDPGHEQAAGMMTGMLDDMEPILMGSLAFVKKTMDWPNLPKAADRLAEMSVRHLNRANELLEQLKSASSPPRTSVDVPSLLQSVIDSAASANSLSQNNLKFSFSVEGDLPSVDGDSGALERVFLNLINNAVHAMPGGGKIMAEAKLHGESILVIISDNGVGMDDETLARVFQPFFTTKGEEGTGLGLAIVDEVVKAHGGQVTVSSRPGEGTTFRIALPPKR